MDNFSISASYKKNNRSVETQSTINNNITVVTPESTIDIDTKPKILPPKHMLLASVPPAEEFKEYPSLTFAQTVSEENNHHFVHMLLEMTIGMITNNEGNLIKKYYRSKWLYDFTDSTTKRADPDHNRTHLS